jgi:hypothetical protein
MSDTETTEFERVDLEARVIDPDKASNKFIRLMDGTKELAVIPWDDAQEIAKAVNNYNDRMP